MVCFPKVIHEVRCPVPGCPSVAHRSGRLHQHFIYRHLISKEVVVQEGRETLPYCDLCGIHMKKGRIIRHRKTACCDSSTQMRWRRRDVTIAVRCLEAPFSLTYEEEAERIKGVGGFKYLGILLDWSDDKWPEILRNIRKAKKGKGQIRKLFRREGEETTVSSKFYQEIVQAVILFVAGTKVLTEKIMQRLEGAHVIFL